MVKMQTVRGDSLYDRPRTIVEIPDDESWLNKYNNPQDKVNGIQDTIRDTIKDTPGDRINDRVQDRVRPNLGKDTILQPPVERVPPRPPYRKVEMPELKKRWGLPQLVGTAEIQKGLVPIGNTGLYATPDTAADPRDCNRYPSSIYCGGAPLSIEPIALDPEVVIDECGNVVGISITPTVGFIQLPPVQIVKPNINCIKPKDLFDKIPAPPDLPPSTIYDLDNETDYVVIFGNRSSIVLDKDEYGYDGLQKGISASGGVTQYRDKEGILIRVTATLNNSFSFRYSSDIFGNPGGARFDKHQMYYRWENNNIFQKRNNEEFQVNELRTFVTDVKPLNRFQDDEFTNGDFPEGGILSGYGPTSSLPVIGGVFTHGMIQGRGKTIKNFLEIVLKNSNTKNTTMSITMIAAFPTGLRRPLPPPPPPDRRCCMSCCPNNSGNQASNDAPLRLIYSKVVQIDKRVTKLEENVGEFPVVLEYFDADEKIPGKQGKTISVKSIADSIPTTFQRVENVAKIIGIEELPAELPESFISRDEGFLGNLIPNQPVYKRNLVQLLGYFMERFEEITGQFEIPIQIKDSDPTTPGDQPKGIKIPNIAEGIAEMMLLLIQTSVNSETLINICTKTLIESGQIKQQDFKNFHQLTTVLDYMGCGTQEVKKSIPLSFSVGAETLPDLLRDTTVEVSVTELKEQRDMKDVFMPLLDSASIIKSVFFRKFDQKGDIKAQLIDMVKGHAATNDKLNGNEKDADGKDNFDRFIDDAEIGFTTEPGITNSTEPYGKDYSRRPRIREIGKDTSDTK
ncbi:hypothetical protein H6F74_05590 [Trichocoleus sp. FACHB-90]|uniref:hypothetical protein n=1 Tax=Cyanophyceae TaxID=3028117 RepID=UPI00168A3694|nr:hypothetical protein [Trichocoleus sp. FACHB-90]MBD1925755.1 hypothetical protein [Trichocoleus sp. FACHB-90]